MFYSNTRRALVLAGFICAMFGASGTVGASVTIQTVAVGNAGNAASTSGYGAVNYAYNIGQYDVTSAQYAAFLNAVAATDTYGLYNAAMAGTSNGNPGIIQNNSPGSYTYSVIAGRDNRPVTDVTFYDAARFTNWLQNGQPVGPEGDGTTETGSYTLAQGTSLTRNPGAYWTVASENEWYKAAYYDPTLNVGAGGYWDFPTQSNSISPSQANYNTADTTDVGTYADPSYYGTYDQGGDAYQWNDTTGFPGHLTERGLRGGAFNDNATGALQSNFTFVTGDPDTVGSNYGFRVSASPEPASLGVFALGILGMAVRRKGARR